MSLANFLIQTCTIQAKSISLSGYENVETWSDILEDVPCRKDSDTAARIADTEVRVNTDDDIFFFNPGVTIERGNRIILDGDYYDVIKVNKLLDATDIHHIEVRARLVDHD